MRAVKHTPDFANDFLIVKTRWLNPVFSGFLPY
jgi:hypothetical protein